ncbi:hypothetical protein Sgleb_67330 [Streptomyces glebosus]|uniref:Uncharacterized protein n=1 Tax=Streptomyces glebosus TaxID=249580 RepID=A0A640T8T4_9ACTN|nr:hypothetical protein Sgleb_67330 [Streptomyces glebosus]GHG87818.1 hypothetical protein GCM10010513_69690 [Streptomyces glebosus]
MASPFPVSWWRICRTVASSSTTQVGDIAGPGHIDIGGEHRARRTDPLGEPEGHGGTAGADLPTPHAGTDPEPVDMAERHGVEQLGERAEADSRLRLLVVQKVSAVALAFSHEAILAEGRRMDSTKRIRWFAWDALTPPSARSVRAKRVLQRLATSANSRAQQCS